MKNKKKNMQKNNKKEIVKNPKKVTVKSQKKKIGKNTSEKKEIAKDTPKKKEIEINTTQRKERKPDAQDNKAPESLKTPHNQACAEETGKRQDNLQEETPKNPTLGRIWEERLYNCPYLIAIAFTSLMVMVFSDEIGIKAIAKEAKAAVIQTIGQDVCASEYPITSVAEQSSKDNGLMEKNDVTEEEEKENAGECKDDNDKKIEEISQNNESVETENPENIEDIPVGYTKFEFYEPQPVESRYYTDAGKIALTTEYPYAKENDSYFKNTAFLGDSRTLGISDYAKLDEADFYCDSGMTIFKLLEEDGITFQKTGEKVNLSQVLQQKTYDKIYMMLGMNELGYGNTQMYLEKYREVVNQIREWQPKAIIYIMANLHVSKEKNNMETEFNNININDKNAASATLANGTDIFYLDANPLFTDEEGFLNAELSFDGVHLYAQHYDAWREFLLEHAVEPVEREINADLEKPDSVSANQINSTKDSNGQKNDSGIVPVD